MKIPKLKDVTFYKVADFGDVGSKAWAILHEYIGETRGYVSWYLKRPFNIQLHYSNVFKEGIDYKGGAFSCDDSYIVSVEGVPLFMLLSMRDSFNYANIYLKVFQDTLAVVCRSPHDTPPSPMS